MGKCDCCETVCVCRLKVERSVRIGRDLQVRGDAEIDGNLTVDGQVLPHRYVLVTKTADQAVNNSTEVAVTWGASSGSGLTFATPGSNFIAPQAGLYSFSAQIIYAPAGTSGAFNVNFTVNNVAIMNVNNAAFNPAGSAAGASVVWYLNAGDVVQCRVNQSVSAGAVNVIGDPTLTKLMITQLR